MLGNSHFYYPVFEHINYLEIQIMKALRYDYSWHIPNITMYTGADRPWVYFSWIRRQESALHIP